MILESKSQVLFSHVTEIAKCAVLRALRCSNPVRKAECGGSAPLGAQSHGWGVLLPEQEAWRGQFPVYTCVRLAGDSHIAIPAASASTERKIGFIYGTTHLLSARRHAKHLTC